ncbi:Na(+)/citrate cotransporter-like isoform X2 [Montipora capricornis]|uniref:Na(+)/citrate cotransporter-like isoform X2 n=1 Tax=Montipora capricornis TaxID=246305 RepID=UPI0035F215A8
METARTNETCIWSLTIDENAIEKPQRDSGSSSQPQTLLQNENASVVKSLVKWHKYLILFFTPILLMALPIAVPSSEARCAYCILIMAVYWVTEVVDLAVTALLPLVLFPLFGVLGSKQVSIPYFKDTNVLFLGGLIVAAAIEKWNLHKRIALRVLLLVGTQPRCLMLGVMLTTAFLSMWISNTATTAMMVPIVEAVLVEIRSESKVNRATEDTNEKSPSVELDVISRNGSPKFEFRDVAQERETEERKRQMTLQETETTRHAPTDQIDATYSKNERQSSVDLIQKEDSKEDPEIQHYKKLCKAMMLSVAYAANIGGTATLTGTAPNLVFSGQVNSLFPNGPRVSFASWFGYAFPQMAVLLIVAWVWLQFLFLKLDFRCCGRLSVTKTKDEKSSKAIRRILEHQYKLLGPMSFAETAVLVHFVLLALLWLFREPKFIKGWSIIFEKGFVQDATVAMTISFSLFLFPSKRPRIYAPDGSVSKPPPGLLDFREMSKTFPWNIIILLGSGFALAEACKVSGLSNWLGIQLAHLNAIPPYAIVVIVCVMITTFTEVTSNTATATIFLPILASLAKELQVHPWYLMLPAAISCSFAFMLPVATPPNAIVFSGGHLKVKDMAKAGLGMNLMAVAALLVCINTYGVAMFDLRNFPDWAKSAAGEGLGTNSNVTVICYNVTSGMNVTFS